MMLTPEQMYVIRRVHRDYRYITQTSVKQALIDTGWDEEKARIHLDDKEATIKKLRGDL